jgi:protoheme IX farnesyltransferase
MEATRLYISSKSGDVKNPMRLFHRSITHLTILFIALAIDPLVKLPLF